MTGFLLASAALLSGYLMGSLNFSIIISRLVTKTDIRTQGSGNAGSTNSLRVLGKKLTLLVILGDFSKGILAVIIGYLLLGDIGKLFGAGGAVLGHVYPAFFGFKGGKGIMTGLAVFIMLDSRIALISLSVFIIVVAITRFVSLGSILAAITLPVLSLPFDKSRFFLAFCTAYALFVIFLHRSNIKRLTNGTESKLGKK